MKEYEENPIPFVLTEKEQIAVLQARASALAKAAKDTTAAVWLEVAKNALSNAGVYWK